MPLIFLAGFLLFGAGPALIVETQPDTVQPAPTIHTSAYNVNVNGNTTIRQDF